MIAEKWEHIKELFEQSLNQSLEERPSFLMQIAQQDPAVADEVRRLLSSFEEAGDFLLCPCQLPPDFFQSPEAEQGRFLPDDLLCERFRIVHLIGRGGMGEVYKAWDEELEDFVALKVLRPEIAAQKLFASRFRRELQLAHKVTHPNVCRIFDSFRHPARDGTNISVLSMEFLQGQTLAEYLRLKGRFTAGEALPVVQQIVRGLNAIHAAGIVHRDLKPSNLLLVSAGPALCSETIGEQKADVPASDAFGKPIKDEKAKRIPANERGLSNRERFCLKITDFGIAGRLSTELAGTQTEASKLIGTPEYMSPEQLEYTRANIQSDIYSLGLILYEMVAGTKPFTGSSAWKRLSENPIPPREFVPELPENWNKTILCCLERNPSYRFHHAEDVSESLEGNARPKIPAKPFLFRLEQAVRPRIGWLAIFFLLAMSLAAGIYRYYHRSPKIPAGAKVLVMNISTSDPALSGVTVAFQSQLAQSAQFAVEEDGEVMQTLREMKRNPKDPLDAATAHEVAWRNGAQLVISGSLVQNSQGYLLSVRVDQMSHNVIFPAASWDKSFLAKDKEELLDAIHNASRWVRNLSGEPETSSREERPVSDTTTSSWRALQLYSDAERKHSAGDITGALVLLQEAIEADPRFAKAHMRLADIWISRKEYKKGYAEWDVARRLVNQTLTNRESFRIQGQYFEDIGEYEKAEEMYGRYETHYPYDYLASFYRGSMLDSMNRKEQALDEMKQAERKAPDAYPPVAYEARLNLMLNKFGDVTLAIQHLRAMQREDTANSIETALDMLQEDFLAALKSVDKLRQSPERDANSAYYSMRAALLREMGNDPAAIDTLKEGASFDRAKGRRASEADKWIALAYIYWEAGHAAECRDAAFKALALENGRLHALQAGTLLARAGFVSDAQSTLSLLPEKTGWPVFEQAWHQLHGEILLAQNHRAAALAEMREAEKNDLPANPKEYLARALQAAGRKDEALKLYREIVQAPAAIWQALDYQYPGFWADMEQEYESNELTPDAPALIDAKSRMSKLRQFSGPVN